MQGLHPLADLAPRDVVARAIVARMRADRQRPRLPRRAAPRRRVPRAPLPLDRRALPRAGLRPGHRAAAGGPRPALRQRRRADRPASAGPPSRGSTPAVRSPAPACTAPTGWRPTRCSRALVFAARIADDITARLAAGELPPTTAQPRQGPPTLVDARRRIDDPAGDDRRRGRRALGGVPRRDGVRAGRHRGRGRPRAPPTTPRPAPGPESWETSNLLHVGQLLTEVAARRGGDPRRPRPRRLPRARRRPLPWPPPGLPRHRRRRHDVVHPRRARRRGPARRPAPCPTLTGPP